MWHDGWIPGWGWFWMWLTMLVLLAALTTLCVFLLRSAHGSSSDADAILEERLARGEIDDDEYRHRRRALHSR